MIFIQSILSFIDATFLPLSTLILCFVGSAGDIFKFILLFIVFVIMPGVAFYLYAIFYAGRQVILNTLVRKDDEHWSRSAPIEDPNQQKMDLLGQAWFKEHEHLKQDVHIFNNGANLYGQYFDLGFDKTVIILSGRTESLRYGFFFAKPYSDNGFNLLVIDARSHGNSDGKYNTVGFEESKDAIAWAKFINETYNIETIVFHGICIGAATGILGLTNENCPPCVKGIVTEGMFANFGISMENHIIERKKNWFLVMQAVDFWFKRYTGHTMTKGPINYIDKMDKPILMLQSKEDPYSTPQNAQKLFDKCASKNKKLVYFEKGGHSLLRITDMDLYDGSIGEFIKTYFS